MLRKLPVLISPWRAFLTELDLLLSERVQLHCIGGFALVAAYGLPRSTNDLDYFSLEPFNQAQNLEGLAGRGSVLAKKHKLYVQRAAVASVPESYEERLSEFFSGYFKSLRLFFPDPYDLVLSKLSRNAVRDREDVEYLTKKCHLSAHTLRHRYASEVRPILIGDPVQCDQALDLWISAYFDARQPD